MWQNQSDHLNLSFGLPVGLETAPIFDPHHVQKRNGLLSHQDRLKMLQKGLFAGLVGQISEGVEVLGGTSVF